MRVDCVDECEILVDREGWKQKAEQRLLLVSRAKAEISFVRKVREQVKVKFSSLLDPHNFR
jgi:hypothetical protein